MIDWQLLVAGVVVAGAAAYLVRAAWRTWAAKQSGCGGGCGCAKPATEGNEALVPVQQLTLRRKRDES